LLDFNQIWIFKTDFHKSPLYQISWKFGQWKANMRTDGWRDKLKSEIMLIARMKLPICLPEGISGRAGIGEIILNLRRVVNLLPRLFYPRETPSPHSKTRYFRTACRRYHSGDLVKKTEMGRACGTYGGEEWCIQDFSGET
jgi:hypothetical protein